MRKLGKVGLALIFLAGVWLVAAPFVTGQQPMREPWTAATRDDVIVGAVLAVLGLAGFFTALAGQVADLYRRSASHHQP
ncbi:SPW repeat protein [Nonomuraea sp. NPDC049784]|uniref:SPW repeat domain-containing protein n=1 Tax=Nonomuraea sp. NPDC049784 TaxID=3154361 RepID=UPI0033E9E336